ncbi:hypothetical protein B0H14DRAFT_2631395 [Mycena olivaceomarginata]|nr:hypothetical protein B0H14DRAFT_2631395 [Mycena olivaceomarginata]
MVNIALTRQFTWPSFFTCYVISLGQIAFGYPASIIGSVLAMPSFLKYMKLTDSAGMVSAEGNQLIGAINGVFQAGAVLGVILNCWVMEKWGRRASLVYCSVLGLFGGALICGARNIAMELELLGRHSIYTSEMSPPALRGLFSGMNGIHIALGYALASYMGLAFYFAKDPARVARLPGDWTALPRLHACHHLLHPRIATLAADEGPLRKHVQRCSHCTRTRPTRTRVRLPGVLSDENAGRLGQDVNPSWSEMHCYPGHQQLRSDSVQIPRFDTKDQLALQCGWLTVYLRQFFGAVVLDYFGRRPLMLTSLAGCVVALSIEAAIVAEFFPPGTDKAASIGGVFALYLFVVVYAVGVDVAGVTFYSEISPIFKQAQRRSPNWLEILSHRQHTSQLFIVITSIGIPLEEMAKIFGDTEDILMYAAEDVKHGPTLHARAKQVRVG